MTEQRWYVVSGYWDGESSDPHARIWTISRVAGREGWNTDAGTDGYGLTKDEADELADAANSAPHQPGREP